MKKMDLTFSGPPLFAPARRTTQQRKYLAGMVVISALLHAVVIALLAFPAPPEQVVTQAPVQAILYTPKVITPQPAQASEPASVAPAPAGQATPPANDAATPDAVPPTATQSESTPQVQPTTPISSGAILTQAEDSPAPSSRSITQSVAAAVTRQQQRLLNSLAAEEARQRRTEISSPDLRIGEYVPPEPQIGEYQINCDKGINSKLAMVAGLIGGNVKCSQRNEFQQFIDKRQHKPKQ
ncbi:hypothetical protein [Alteromonas gilva]|uniref:Energy transducer TonB n=1 Tax=Alteromonas gilva TaxID=2987522 RepID=A0ABT5L5E0_9ALTE|nr:hypothetical protein [Alteromonas gilva]MDC8832093.1 hypothetical protein [Alteromonas gilva]